MSFHQTDPQLMPQVEERVGPGRRLGDTRQAANLSVDEVAVRLHLDVDTIRALEADEYDRLPGPTFVRGYLRGYARLLDLPPGPILEAFAQRGLEPPALVPDIAVRAQARTTDVAMRIGTYLIATGLVLLVVLWWHNQRPAIPPAAPSLSTGPSAPGVGDAAPAPTAGGDPPAAPWVSSTPTEPMASGVEPRGATRPSGPAPLDATPSATVANPPGVALERAFAALPSQGADEAMSLSVSPLVPSAERNAAPALATPRSSTLKIEPALDVAVGSAARGGIGREAPPARGSAAEPAGNASSGGVAGTTATPRDLALAPALPPASVAPLGENGDRLVMQFAHESWVEVYDRLDQRLVYRLAREGAQIDVRGTGPMRVLLGNADDVRIEYNGRAHQLAARGPSGVARFVVGETGLGTDEAMTRPVAADE